MLKENVSFDDTDAVIRAEPSNETVTVSLRNAFDPNDFQSVQLTVWQARKLAHALVEFSETVERKLKNINTEKRD